MSDEKKYQQDDPWTQYSREYHQKSPEKALRWKLSSAKNLLKRNGYSITEQKRKKAPGEGAS